MKSKNYLGIFGSLLIIGGALSPMLRIPIIGNWNYLDLDLTLASIVFILAGLGLFAAVTSRFGLLRFAGWGALAIVLLTLMGVYLKVNDTFSFIPFKKLAAVATNLVKYKWLGWALLLMGCVLNILAGSSSKSKAKQII